MSNNPYMPVQQRPDRFDRTYHRRKDPVWREFEDTHYTPDTK